MRTDVMRPSRVPRSIFIQGQACQKEEPNRKDNEDLKSLSLEALLAL